MKKPKTSDDMLKIMREFLFNTSYEEVTKFWNIITALRGPDYVSTGDKGEIKAATTQVIRHAVIGDSTADFIGCLSDKDTTAKVKIRKAHEKEFTDHFWSHAKLAFIALGLRWEKKNG